MDMEIEQEPKRGPGRPKMLRSEAPHSEGIRSEAPRKRVRKHKGGQYHDKFYVDPATIPEGSSYEWKTHSVYNKVDPGYQIQLREQGWEPVDPRRHPELIAEGHKGPIIRDGLMLCERPIELTREAMEEDNHAARAAVRAKEQQMHGTPDGHLPRMSPQISKSYESMPIDD